MEWVKSTVDYYNVTEIAMGTDAMEVMFKRGDALAGKIEKDGFIPDAMLHQLGRRPAQAKKTAEQLVKAGLWARVRGGYLIVDWADINDEAVRLSARKKRDRERKRADRAASMDRSTDASVDGSADSPADCPGETLLDHQSKNQKKNAAAATRDADDPAGDLPPAVAILRSALEARNLTVRWDRLTAAELAEIEKLVALHGDAALVKNAMAAYQPNQPPVYAKAWLGGWRDLRAPGQLELVETCPEPGHSGTTKHCTQCASERLERKIP